MARDANWTRKGAAKGMMTTLRVDGKK